MWISDRPLLGDLNQAGSIGDQIHSMSLGCAAPKLFPGMSVAPDQVVPKIMVPTLVGSSWQTITRQESQRRFSPQRKFPDRSPHLLRLDWIIVGSSHGLSYGISSKLGA
jgi:endonuclease/exonuclease/phosphatase family metal-dependent hydrolase